MEDLFKIEDSTPELMNKYEYFERTHKLLDILMMGYSKSWLDRRLKDDEYPEESVCNACNACGIFQEGVGQCFQDREEGDCYVRFLDPELFVVEFENEIEELNNLLSVSGFTA